MNESRLTTGLTHQEFGEAHSCAHPRWKRVMDIVLAGAALCIAGPVMLLVSALLWVQAPGYVIYTQERLGRHGKRFNLYKFRKFPPHWKTEGAAVTVARDPRRTRIGTILERTKLDELPQFWNVLKGDMAIVGPRPELPYFSDLFVGGYRALLDYTPGLFGPSSIPDECHSYPLDEDPETYYRHVLFPLKAELNLAYYPTATTLTDLCWIGKGVWGSLFGTIQWKRILRVYGITVAIDVLVLDIAWTLLSLARFSDFSQAVASGGFLTGLWMFPLLFIIVACVLNGRCYRYPRHFLAYDDALHLIIALSLAWMSGVLILVLVGLYDSPYLIPIEWLVFSSCLLLGRMSFVIRVPESRIAKQRPRCHIAIYGAGEAGISLAHWTRVRSESLKFVGFLDDNPDRHNQFFEGKPVLGSERDVATLRAVHQIEELWVSFMPDALKYRRLIASCEKHDIKLLVIPELDPHKITALRQNSVESHYVSQ